ncbi:methionyl-tRNA formyltransferase [Phascolarctobacterium sp. Marseille-Q4147]|uniref:methionyl-tRNA formyltransferase n=1 Tax=Phascolarctobacterium TaxID=33024 RepID=UPI001B3406B5|nr:MULTISPECIES: methionyl-tRNA formyltransferase [Phascolarctobacterium]MBS5426709.1 methionyl-tRNA formyltransferase [Phascolarctobacterium succinatutens]QTV77749.1 methionyl-tRNA formyltransferase [Phascolarctobacterium sp. Marseille-Q4147]
MRIVFMGTPDFAVGSLQALCESGKHEILAVVTQPDRPKGRGNKLLQTPVKEYALEQGLTVYQPQKVKTPEFVELLHELQPELIVVAAFGQFLSKEILELPKYGCINVHASLLPKYRGAAPIQYAIIKGEKESGVTIMQMDIGMDTGAMLDKVVVPIAENTTMGELHDALREQGAALLLEVIDKIAAGTAVAEPQDDAQATYATLLDRSMEHIDWSKTAQEVHNLIRGFNPAPSTFTKLPNGKSLKIWGSKMTDKSSAAAAGTVIETGKHSFFVACGEGVLEITEVQPESKKRMPAQVFLNGRGVQEGDLLA